MWRTSAAARAGAVVAVDVDILGAANATPENQRTRSINRADAGIRTPDPFITRSEPFMTRQRGGVSWSSSVGTSQ